MSSFQRQILSPGGKTLIVSSIHLLILYYNFSFLTLAKANIIIKSKKIAPTKSRVREELRQENNEQREQDNSILRENLNLRNSDNFNYGTMVPQEKKTVLSSDCSTITSQPSKKDRGVKIQVGVKSAVKLEAITNIVKGGPIIDSDTFNLSRTLLDLCKQRKPRLKRSHSNIKTISQSAKDNISRTTNSEIISSSSAASSSSSLLNSDSASVASSTFPVNGIKHMTATEAALDAYIKSKRLSMNSGPQVEIIDGKIVVKESSLTVAPETTVDDYEEIEEGIHPTATYSSFRNKIKTTRWGLEETRRFYQALRQCGTDFTLMQAFFTGRARRSLKLKFFR